MSSGSAKSILSRFDPRRLLPVLIVSLISSLVVTTYQISFGSLIFSGDLSGYVSNGIGFCLMGVVLIATIEALLSGNPGLVAIPTVGSAVIVATIAANITGILSDSPQRIFPTVVAGIIVASFLTGGAFILLGWLKLGNLIRFIPHPVIGGFLAGTGWLVFQGALKVMNGIALDWDTLTQFRQAEAIVRWLPGMCLGAIMLIISRRFKHYLVTPLLILSSIGIFYLILELTQTTQTQAVQMGLLFEPFTSGSLWKPPPTSQVSLVDWGVILRQSGEIATLILISSITILLYASGVEVTAGIEVDLNRELRACGFGNLAAGLSASIPGYTIITMSVLSYKLGARSRLVGILVAIFTATMLFFGAEIISLFPKPVLGGIATFLGLSFLFDWVVLGFRRLSFADYAIVVVIMFVMGFFGLLAGLGTGIALAAGLFIIQYSQVPVVRHTLNGRSFHSRVSRPFSDAELITQFGSALAVLEMQGFIFFGTANQIYESMKTRLKNDPSNSLKVVMLDFRRVIGIDVSAALSFVRLKRLLQENHILLVFTNLKPKVEHIMRQDVLTPKDQDSWYAFEDLDHGVEWFEEWILANQKDQSENAKAVPGAVQAGIKAGGLAMLFAALGEEARTMIDPGAADETVLNLMACMEKMEMIAGQVIIQQGEPQHKLYFLDSGLLNIAYETSSGKDPVRLETGGPGTIVGEIGLYLGSPATAKVTAAQPGTIYSLSAEDLEELEHKDPATAAMLHRFLLKRVAKRLINALETVDMLMN